MIKVGPTNDLMMIMVYIEEEIWKLCQVLCTGKWKEINLGVGCLLMECEK